MNRSEAPVEPFLSVPGPLSYMSTFDAGEFTLEQVREYVWEIPQEGEMREIGRAHV